MSAPRIPIAHVLAVLSWVAAASCDDDGAATPAGSGIDPAGASAATAPTGDGEVHSAVANANTDAGGVASDATTSAGSSGSGPASNPAIDAGEATDATAGAGGSRAETDATASACPDNPPAIGAQCEAPNAECEFGTDPVPACRLRTICERESADMYKWRTYSASTRLDCGEQDACPATPPDAVACPDTRSACFYEDTGVLCFCETCCTEPVCSILCAGAPELTPLWRCEPAPQPPCPKLRPNLGTPCELPEGTVCYGNGCVGETSCTGGIWVKGPFLGCDL